MDHPSLFVYGLRLRILYTEPVPGMDPNTNVDSLPVQHNRQAFLLGLEKLLSLSASQAKAAECLKRLCNGKEPLHSAPWVSDIAHRRSLLIALANPSLKAPDAMKEAAHCLALVASHADGS